MSTEFPSTPEDPAVWGETVGPFYSWQSLAEALDIPEASLREQANEGSLLVLKTSDGYDLMPAFQVNSDTKTLLEGFDSLLKLFSDAGFDLRSANGWLVAGWLTADQDALEGKSAIQWLQEKKDSETLMTYTQNVIRRAQSPQQLPV